VAFGIVDFSPPAMSGSHNSRTVSGMFHNMSILTLVSLVPLSDLASFAVERCAAQGDGLYMYTAPTTITFRLNIYQQFELASCACDEPTSFFALGISFVLFFLTFRSWTPSSPVLTPIHLDTHGRSVLISLW
jgi:hypothetical protein